MMPQDLLPARHGTRLGMAFWAAKLAFLLLGLASTVLMVRLAVPLSRDLLLSTVPRLCAAVRGYLVPPYIFVVVNFMIFVILKLPDTKNHNHRKESIGAAAAAAAAAASSPTKPPKDLPHPSSQEVSPNACSDAASLFGPASSPKAGDPLPGGWPDGSSPTPDFEGDSAASPPDAVEVGVRPSDGPSAPIEDDDHDSMDATWKAITGGEPGRRQLKKNETWSTPPRVHLETAGRQLRKSETFRQSPSPWSAAATRRAVVERRVNGREVPVAEDHDDINRQFEAFIKKSKDQMRLQQQESAAQRYMEILNSPGY